MLLVDTGVLFAVADGGDADHEVCDELLAAYPEGLAVPTPVIVESTWLIENRLGAVAEVAFLNSVTSGELTRIDLVDRYSDLGLGLGDAASSLSLNDSASPLSPRSIT